MATTPQQPPPKPQPPPQQPPKPPQQPAKPPEPEVSATPVGETQLKESREIEDQGVDTYKRDQERSRQRQVPGVAGADPDKPGTPYTPPEGHSDMNPGPGEPGGPSAGHYSEGENVQGTGKLRDRDSEASKAAKDDKH